MIGGRGGARARAILTALLGCVLGVCGLIWFAPRHSARPDPEREAVLQAAAAVEKRVSEPRKAKEIRLPAVPAVARAVPQKLPSAGGGSLRVIRDSDLELLKFLEEACLTRDEEARKETYRVISEGLAKAASTRVGSTLVAELIDHRDSPEEILRIVGEYLFMDGDLTGAERAIAVGEYESVALRLFDNYYTAETLLNKMTLRALAELQQGEAGKAVFSCVQGYHFSRLRMEKGHLWVGCYPGLDLLLEKVVDTACKRESLDAESRTTLVGAVRWHPEWKEITDYVCESVSAKSRFERVTRHPIEVVQVASEWSSSYQYDRILIGTLERTLGRRPFELGEQVRALETKVPVEAPTTKSLVKVAYQLNHSFWERELRADMAQLVFALKELRRVRGGYPALMDEIEPQVSGLVPIDPGSGRPVRYEPRGAGFRLVRESATGRVAVAWEAVE